MRPHADASERARRVMKSNGSPGLAAKPQSRGFEPVYRGVCWARRVLRRTHQRKGRGDSDGALLARAPSRTHLAHLAARREVLGEYKQAVGPDQTDSTPTLSSLTGRVNETCAVRFQVAGNFVEPSVFQDTAEGRDGCYSA